MTIIVKETTGQLAHGVKTVTTSASQLTSVKLGQGNFKGLLLKAPGSSDDTPNTLTVFVGNLHITANQAATGGFPLAPGETLSLPLDDAAELYVIATDGNQKINWILM